MESKPIISYAGDEALFSSLEFGISQQLSVEHVEWRRSFGRAAKKVCVEAAFIIFSEDIIPKENDWKLIGQPFFHTYWTDCSDVDVYKGVVKDEISGWLSILKNHGVHDWLIICVETMDSRKGNKTKLLPKASVLDKIKNDFCNKHPERCLALLDPLKSDARGAESWQNLLQRVRQLVLAAYNRNLIKFEEHMRSQRERRNEPGWSFCEYFLLQEELAFVFEMLGIYDESLVQYDELDALFTQFVLNSNVGDTPQWLHEFSRTCDSWMGLALARATNGKKRNLINTGKASLLDLRNYLFSRQCGLLLLLFRPWEIAQRMLPFLHNCINELQILEVSLPPGAMSCWVFLSCLEVLHTCERFNDSSHVEAYSLYTAGLWAYARDKLQELGALCGLMPGSVETSEQLHLAVGLLAGMVEESTEESKNPQTPMNKLREALSSRDAFQHHYLELSELAMGTFKHIGRIRSARLIGKDLAQFYMKLGEPHKAAAFLCDVLKTCLKENWTVLATQTQLELVECYKIMKDYEKCTKMCAQIASSDCLGNEQKLMYFEQMFALANSYCKDAKVMMSAQSIFSVKSISIKSDSDIIICDSSLTISMVLRSKLIGEIRCRAISLSLKRLAGEELVAEGSQSELPSVNVGALKSTDSKLSVSDWTNNMAPVVIELEEHFDYKQDHSLTSVSVACTNLHTLLRRRDSQYALKEKEVIKEDFAECVTLEDVTLKPGNNALEFSYRVSHAGNFSSNQLSVQTENLEFLVANVYPTVSYKVVCEKPKMFLQRAGKGDLVAGAESELVLTVHTGSSTIEPDTVVRLTASKYLLLKVKDVEDEEPAFMQSVECPLSPVGPFQTAVCKVKVLAEVSSQKDPSSMERKVSIVNPWSLEKQESSLVFVLPFSATHKLQTANNRKYVQVVVQGLQKETFELSGHELSVLNCSEVAVVPLNPLRQSLTVCKDQNASYAWELVSNLADCPPLHLEFVVSYCQKVLDVDAAALDDAGLESRQPLQVFKHQFDIVDYKTLYTLRSKVEPVSSEFCRVGSICHMNISIATAHALESPSLMYEVLADQMMWAVCGRTAGVVMMSSEGTHSVTLDVMPLSRGFLPLPAIRLSKYIAGSQKAGVKDSPKKPELPLSTGPQYPRLEPFGTGQVFHWTKGIQVHVLPALGATSGEGTTS